jgi:hypothetical protein
MIKIEDITKAKLGKASESELLGLRLRFVQLWDKDVRKEAKGYNAARLNKSDFLARYKLLVGELNVRKIKHTTNDIDRAAFKKSMEIMKYGVDVAGLEPIPIISDVVMIDSDFTKSEKAEIVIKSIISKEIERIISEHIESQISKDCEVVADTPDKSLSLYDLTLCPKSEMIIFDKKTIEILKPYSNEHAARIIDPSKFEQDSFRRVNNKNSDSFKNLPDGVSVIIGKLKGGSNTTIQAYRFDVDSFTVAEAKKWLKDNDVSFKDFEPAAEKAEKSLENTKKEFEKGIDIEFLPVEKAKDEEHIVCGIVYEPNTVDAQGDRASAEEIRKAAYYFMENIQVFKVNHKGNPAKIRPLESYIAPVDFEINKKDIKKGSWILTCRILDDNIWEDIKNGKLTGYSMAGRANS